MLVILGLERSNFGFFFLGENETSSARVSGDLVTAQRYRNEACRVNFRTSSLVIVI